MSDTKNGGTAFPKLSQDTRWGTFTSTDGISVRDYFAAKAMQALIHVQVKTHQQQTASAAYEWADEMLEAREQ